MLHAPKDLKMFQNASPSAFEKGRFLRQSQTPEEALMWEKWRNGNCGGAKFRRQHPFQEYILDFICAKKNVVVEIDGGYHLSKEQMEYDENRTAFLEEQELKVLRFTNLEVNADIEKVLKSIKEFIK